MFDRAAPDLRRVLSEAADIAQATSSPLTSVHLLLAMFVTPCAARDALSEVGVDESRVIAAYKKLRGRQEHSGALEQIRVSAEKLSGASQAGAVDSMLLLASLLKVRNALAAQVLRRGEVNVTALRARVIGQVTLGVDRASSSRLRAFRASQTDIEVVSDSARHTSPQTHEAFTVPAAASRQRAAARRPPPPAPPTKAPRPSTPPSAVRQVVQQQPRMTPPPVPVEAVLRSQQPEPVLQVVRSTPPAPEPPESPALGPFELCPKSYPTLRELGRNLSALAAGGEISLLIGRDDIVDQVIEILSMRKANNPCLVGEAGVGKTAIVEGLAARVAGNTERFGKLGSAIIVELHVSSLLAGTSYRGAFAERMKALRAEVAAAKGSIIIFLDEIHTMMGAGAGDGALDAANDLKTALARGRFPLIGATTRDEYIKHIEKDAAFDRRFQVIEVQEPSIDETLKILSGIAQIYVEHHNIPYSHEAIASAVHLSHRFITDRQLPDKAISILDRAGAQAKRRGKKAVEADDIARAVQNATKVPMARLLADERSRIRDLSADLRRQIVGQPSAIARISRRIRRNYAGFSGEKPLACFLFAGPPGVGKTETAKAIAQALFLVDDALVVFDMSEFTEAGSASRLIGSPPGYVGHQQRGQLSEAMHKRPYRVLLFEHVERAAPEVMGLVGQILATGRVTDTHGRCLDMRNTVVVMTSNAGTDAILSGATKRVVGFSAPPRPVGLTDSDETQLVEHVTRLLGQDICGAVDDVVVFRPLSDWAGRAVVRKAVDECLARLFENRLIEVTADDSVVQHVVESGGFDPATGARALRGLVDDIVVDFLTEQILDWVLRPGSKGNLLVSGGTLLITTETVDEVTVGNQATAPTSTDLLLRP